MNKQALETLTKLIETEGRLQVWHEPGGSGMGYYFGATIGKDWPYGYASNVEGAIMACVSARLRIKRDEAQRLINEIDASSKL